MRKSLLICLLAILLCLSACGTPAANTPGTTETKPSDTSAADTKPTSTQPESQPTEPAKSEEYTFEPGYFPIPTEPATFTFLSGAGAWQSVMDINTDGTFSGQYRDGEMGASGEGYQATYYVCDFSGVFADVEKVDKHTYKVRLISMETVEPIGKEWIDKEIRYIAAAPHGLYDYDKKENCREYIVYMPTTPVAELSEEFLSWWPYRGENKDTLDCFGLMNVTTKDGFFYMPEA
jgi:hypothetical protein